MNGRIFIRVDHEAVDDADREPHAEARRAARAEGPSARRSPTTTLAQAAVVPTERSMPAVMMTKHMPRLVSANIEL